MILLWTPVYGKRTWRMSFNTTGYREIVCPSSYTGGEPIHGLVTYNRREASRAQFIIFHARDIDTGDLPPRASHKQIWIVFNRVRYYYYFLTFSKSIILVVFVTNYDNPSETS